MKPNDSRGETRRSGRLARQHLKGAERINAENRLHKHLQSLHAVSATSVGVFVAHDGEPDLAPLIRWLWANQTTVSLPVLSDEADDYSMRFVPWLAGDTLEAGRYGIPVPPAREAIEPATVLVSFVGFDRFGNRMGRGGGFFDRYLATSNTKVIGVGFEAQRFGLVPAEPHDVPLPTVVTDAGVRFVGSEP